MIMSLTLVLVLLSFSILFILAERSRKRCISQKMPLPPSPRGLPFIGNLLEIGTSRHRSLADLAKKHGPLMLLHLGSIPTLVASSPDFAQELMKTHDLVFASRPQTKVSKILSYNGIDIAFAPYGDCWRQMRKVCMLHLLSPKMVQSFSSVRTEEVALLLKKISDHNGSRLCITELLSELTNNVLCRTVLGSQINDDRRRLVSDLVKRSSAIFFKGFVEDLFPKFKWLDSVIGLEGKLRSHIKAWDALMEEFIEEHLINKSEDQSHCSDFIDILLQLQKDSSMEFVLTKEHIKAVLIDMFSAGTETSFTTLDWSMAELIQNPKVMKKVQEEVRAIVNGDDTINEQHLNKMNYLKAVIKEVLRLHPPAPLLLPRESMKDCQIQGYHIPKQTRVIINAWAIGRDKAYWEDPEEFMPERFLSSTLDFKGREFHFIPFGAGRRICPGMPFANEVVELALASLLLRFDWNLPISVLIEDINMEESPGVITTRKDKLELVPILVKVAS